MDPSSCGWRHARWRQEIAAHFRPTPVCAACPPCVFCLLLALRFSISVSFSLRMLALALHPLIVFSSRLAATTGYSRSLFDHVHAHWCPLRMARSPLACLHDMSPAMLATRVFVLAVSPPTVVLAQCQARYELTPLALSVPQLGDNATYEQTCITGTSSRCSPIAANRPDSTGRAGYKHVIRCHSTGVRVTTAYVKKYKSRPATSKTASTKLATDVSPGEKPY